MNGTYFLTVGTVAAGALGMLWPFFNLIGKSVIRRTQIDEEPQVLHEVSKTLYYIVKVFEA